VFHSNRVFHIGSNTVVSISGLTVTNGYAVYINFEDNSGGGIWNDHATLTVTNCTLVGNSAYNRGGGIYNDHATLTVRNVILSGNSSYEGGAIDNDGSDGGSASLEVVDSTLSGNSTRGDAGSGGGIFNEGLFGGNAGLRITNSTLSGNSAAFGGGIYNQGYSGRASLQIVNSTLSDNSAKDNSVFGDLSSGGAIYHNGCCSGSASLIVLNSTFSGNSAGYLGGGIYSAGSVEIGSTILNVGASGPNIFNDGGTVTSLGYNLSSDDGDGFLTAVGDQINTDPLLLPLQDNGGPTFTHALLACSPAIDNGRNFNGSSTDQRGVGFARSVDQPGAPNAAGGDGTDIGAFEIQSQAQSLADLAVSMQVVKTKSKGDTQLSYTIPVKNLGPDQADEVVLTDPLPAGTSFLSVTSTPGPCGAPPVYLGGTVTCNLGSMPSGTTATVTIGVSISAKGKTTITNTATVSSTTSDPNPGNNSAAIQTSKTGK
jgi:uncharacterized repeat protein (TIGR01451 family)